MIQPTGALLPARPLADGGDSFPAFTAGTNRVYAPLFDLDALAAYLGTYGPVAPGPMNRITKLP